MSLINSAGQPPWGAVPIVKGNGTTLTSHYPQGKSIQDVLEEMRQEISYLHGLLHYAKIKHPEIQQLVEEYEALQKMKGE